MIFFAGLRDTTYIFTMASEIAVHNSVCIYVVAYSSLSKTLMPKLFPVLTEYILKHNLKNKSNVVPSLK